MNYELGMKRGKTIKKGSKNPSFHNSKFVIHNSARRRALVVGSVAFDVVFDVHGTIKERIILEAGKLGRQNLMFTAKMKQQQYGGTGANIAYGLGLLGAKPILFAAVGRDFKPHFHKHLRAKGVDVRVHTDPKNWTATFYGMSDEAREQIGVWQPNAHDTLETISLTDTLDKKILKGVSVAIFSGKPTIAVRHMETVRKVCGAKIQTIFDPGQMVVFYSKAELVKGLKLADIFIVNEVELKTAQATLGCGTEQLFKWGPKVIIETKGELGSVLYEPGKRTKVSAVTPRRIVETTGAGDAYRAGLMFGLLEGFDLEKSCHIGAILGARSVETTGGQTYELLPKDLENL